MSIFSHFLTPPACSSSCDLSTTADALLCRYEKKKAEAAGAKASVRNHIKKYLQEANDRCVCVFAYA